MTTVPLRYAADVRTSSVDKHSREGERPVQLCNYVDVYKNDKVRPSRQLMRATATVEEVARFRLEVGDSILTKDSEDPQDIGVSAYVDATADDFVCGYHLAIARPTERTYPRYLTWALRSRPMLDHFTNHASGISRYGLTTAGLRAGPVPWHEVEEQRRIADFLDDRVARIDQIITARRHQTAMLYEAMTTGVTAAIDSVPASECPLWIMMSRITDGAHVSPETEDGIYDFVSTRDVDANGDIDFEGSVKTSESSYNMLVRQGCQPIAGDLLFSKDGTVGRTAIVPVNRMFVVASSLIIIRPDTSRVHPLYLHYMFKHSRVLHQIDGFVKGAGLPRISITNLKRVLGIFPDLPDQRRLGRSLDTEFTKSTHRQEQLLKSVDLLQEYKQSLITAAVTGEIDVTTAGSGIPG